MEGKFQVQDIFDVCFKGGDDVVRCLLGLVSNPGRQLPSSDYLLVLINQFFSFLPHILRSLLIGTCVLRWLISMVPILRKGGISRALLLAAPPASTNSGANHIIRDHLFVQITGSRKTERDNVEPLRGGTHE
jgi:hypothetical protein